VNIAYGKINGVLALEIKSLSGKQQQRLCWLFSEVLKWRISSG